MDGRRYVCAVIGINDLSKTNKKSVKNQRECTTFDIKNPLRLNFIQLYRIGSVHARFGFDL